MKLVIVMMLLAKMLFAQGGFEEHKKLNEVVLPTILKGSHKKAILNFDFYKNEKLLSLSKDGVLKIWNIQDQELIKTIKIGSDLKEAMFSKDGKKIYSLDKESIKIYDANQYKFENSIKIKNALDMTITSNNEAIIATYYKINKYNLMNGKLIYSIDHRGNWDKYISLSQNEKYIAVSDSRRTVSVYKSTSGEFISELPKFSSIRKVEFLDNKNIMIVDKPSYSSFGYVYDFKTSKLKFKTIDYKDNYISSMLVLKDKYLITNAKNRVVSQINKDLKKIISKAKIDNSYVSPYGLKLSFDNTILAVGYTNGDFKLYSTNNFLTKTTQKETPLKQEPQIIYKDRIVEKEKVVYQDKIVEKEKIVYKDRIIEKEVIKEVEKPKTNQAPTLILEASVTQGVIPLKVDFTIIANDDKSIDSYYINFAGKESMAKGNPPTTLSKTFHNPGSYKVVVVVKDSDGEITKKSIEIQPREQTFSDYKKMYQ